MLQEGTLVPNPRCSYRHQYLESSLQQAPLGQVGVPCESLFSAIGCYAHRLMLVIFSSCHGPRKKEWIRHSAGATPGVSDKLFSAHQQQILGFIRSHAQKICSSTQSQEVADWCAPLGLQNLHITPNLQSGRV